MLVHLAPTLQSFATNCCVRAVWHGGKKLVALLRFYWRPGCCDGSLHRVYFGVGFWPMKHNNNMKHKINFHLKVAVQCSSFSSPVLVHLNPGKTLLEVWQQPQPTPSSWVDIFWFLFVCVLFLTMHLPSSQISIITLSLPSVLLRLSVKLS